MTTEQQCVVTEYNCTADADVGCKVLETANFTKETVSIITRNNDQSVSDLDGLKDNTVGAPPAEESVGMGGALGGSVGAALGTATLIVTDTEFRLDQAERLLKTTGPKSLKRLLVSR